jgi:hypothetical protein
VRQQQPPQGFTSPRCDSPGASGLPAPFQGDRVNITKIKIKDGDALDLILTLAETPDLIMGAA